MNTTKERVAKLTAIIGTNGTGKTSLLEHILKASGQKCLVITPDDVEWRQYEATELSSREDFLFDGIRRHIYNGDKKNNTLDRLKYFKNGIIVFDDCRAYLKAQMEQEIRNLIIRRRQRGVDIFVVAHGFTEIPPVFFTFTSEIILFRTTDNIKKRKDCLKDYERMQEAQIRVNKKSEKDKHHKEIIKFY